MNCSEAVDVSPSYLAGTLDARRSAQFAAHLDTCPACASTVNLDWRLRDAVLAEPVNTAVVEAHVRREIRASGGIRRWLAAGAIAAALVTGVFVYRTLTAVNPVYADAVDDHRREVVEHERRTWTNDAAVLAKLAQRDGIAAPDVNALAPSGYHFEHAKLCKLNGRLVLHMVYANGAQEISVFLSPAAGGAAPVRATTTDGECVAAFENARVSGIVVSGQSRDETIRIARHAASVL